MYTNARFRRSEVKAIPFGNSDHYMLEYVRYMRDPPIPARVIRRRSYKNFILQDFLNDLKVLDWSPLYACMDLDYAVHLFTSSFKNVLDLHAP